MGVNPFIATGNTFGASTWSGGEAIIRFQTGPVFSGLTNDYWAPTNWMALDTGDIDLGGSGALIVDVPGATPSKLVVSLGKDGNAYLLNRTNLGGVSVPLAQAHISSGKIIQAAATYRTALGTYVVCCGNITNLVAFRITATSPPTITGVWTVNQNGRGSPFVTSTDGTNNVIVWGIGSEGDQRLHGFNGDTGAVVFNGGGAERVDDRHPAVQHGHCRPRTHLRGQRQQGLCLHRAGGANRPDQSDRAAGRRRFNSASPTCRA